MAQPRTRGRHDDEADELTVDISLPSSPVGTVGRARDDVIFDLAELQPLGPWASGAPYSDDEDDGGGLGDGAGYGGVQDDFGASASHSNDVEISHASPESTLRHRHARTEPDESSAQASASSAPGVPSAQPLIPSLHPDAPGKEGDERQCRICFGGPEDEAELGRLISPCLCSGSMRYVHVQCINRWRGSGPRARAFFECPQCGHQYHIRRTLVFGMATSRRTQILITTFIFLIVAHFVGHVLLKFVLAQARAAADERAAAKASGVGPGTHHSAGYWESEDGTMVVYTAGPAAFALDVLSEVVDTFLDLALLTYDAMRHGGPLMTWLMMTVIRLILGLSVLGTLSSLSLLNSLRILAPLQIVHALRSAGLFNAEIFDKPRAYLEQWTARLGGQSTLLVIAFVLVGVVNSVILVYDFVQTATLEMLRYVETQILEVNPEEERRRNEERGWWHKWAAERRWRNTRGWVEVWNRAKGAAAAGLRAARTPAGGGAAQGADGAGR